MSNQTTRSTQTLSAERLHKLLNNTLPQEMVIKLDETAITAEAVEQTKEQMKGITVEYIPHGTRTLVVSVYESIELLERDLNKTATQNLLDQQLIVVNKNALTVTCLVSEPTLKILKRLMGLVA